MRLGFAHCEVHLVFAIVFTLTQRVDYTEIDARIIGDTSQTLCKNKTDRKKRDKKSNQRESDSF